MKGFILICSGLDMDRSCDQSNWASPLSRPEPSVQLFGIHFFGMSRRAPDALMVRHPLPFQTCPLGRVLEYAIVRAGDPTVDHHQVSRTWHVLVLNGIPLHQPPGQPYVRAFDESTLPT
jgi:hypothetical protein